MATIMSKETKRDQKKEGGLRSQLEEPATGPKQGLISIKRNTDRKEAGPTFPPSSSHRASPSYTTIGGRGAKPALRRPGPGGRDSPTLRLLPRPYLGETKLTRPSLVARMRSAPPASPTQVVSHSRSTAPTGKRPLTRPWPGLQTSWTTGNIGPRSRSSPAGGRFQDKEACFLNKESARKNSAKRKRTEKAKRPGWGRVGVLCGQGVSTQLQAVLIQAPPGPFTHKPV